MEDRSRYLVAHVVVRLLRGGYLRAEPADLTFVTNSYGKLVLVRAAGQPLLSFDLAHSGDVVLFAMAVERRVGVHIEAFRTDLDVVELARRQFSSSEAGILAGPSSNRTGGGILSLLDAQGGLREPSTSIGSP